jgi:hypothetical protein
MDAHNISQRQPYVYMDAKFNEDKKRVSLLRVWNEKLKKCCVVMNFPSSADKEKDDMTIRRTVQILNFNGFGSLFVVNVGVSNFEEKIKDALIRDLNTTVVIAWGNHLTRKDNINEIKKLRKMIEEIECSSEILCFGININGTPKLPTMLSTKTVLRVYDELYE